MRLGPRLHKCLILQSLNQNSCLQLICEMGPRFQPGIQNEHFLYPPLSYHLASPLSSFSPCFLLQVNEFSSFLHMVEKLERIFSFFYFPSCQNWQCRKETYWFKYCGRTQREKRNLMWAGGSGGMGFRKQGEVAPMTGFWRLGNEVFQGD